MPCVRTAEISRVDEQVARSLVGRLGVVVEVAVAASGLLENPCDVSLVILLDTVVSALLSVTSTICWLDEA